MTQVLHNLNTLFFLMASVLLVLTGCASSRTIVNGLDERDANEILVLLAQENIPAYKIEQKAAVGGATPLVLWDVAVSSEDAPKAMEILNRNGLPRQKSPSLIDLFSANGLVPSEMSEKVRYQAGLADSIANMIRKIDGVVDADVRLSFPEEDPLNPTAKLAPVTASVYVKHTGILDDPNSHLVTKIKRLVSGAVTGLSYNNVTVIADRARFAINPSKYIQLAPREYTNSMGFVIAKSSAERFQFFFFFTIFLMILLIAVFSFLFWKIYPLLKRRGGMMQLCHLTPLPKAPASELPKLAGEEAKKEQTMPAEQAKTTQENIEEK